MKPSDGGPVAVPSQDMVLGIYYLTQERPGAVGEGKFFKNVNEAILAYENGAYLTLDPEKTKAIMKSVETEIAKLENLGKNPIIITSPIVRMYFKRLTEDYFKDLIVVSYNEIENNVELQSVGMVTA